MKRIWTFLVGDSRLAPIGVAVAVLAALVLPRIVPASALFIGALYLAIVAATLVTAVFER